MKQLVSKQGYLDAGEKYLTYLAERIFQSIMDSYEDNTLYYYDGDFGFSRSLGFLNLANPKAVKGILDSHLDKKMPKDQGVEFLENIPVRGIFPEALPSYQVYNHMSEDCKQLIEKYFCFKYCLRALEDNDKGVDVFKERMKFFQEKLLENTGSAGMNLWRSIFQWVSCAFFGSHSEKMLKLAEGVQEENVSCSF